MTGRDTQRSKLYAAERRAFPGHDEHGFSAGGLTVEQCQALLDKWAQSKMVRRRWPLAAVRVEARDGRGRRSACYAKQCAPIENDAMLHPRPAILLPKWARSKIVLAHEYAHHLNNDPSSGRKEGRAAHGWQFAECYVYLVRVFIGKWAAEKLEAEFRSGKVRYRQPRTVTMSEAERAKRAERMRAINAARREAVACKEPGEVPGVRVRVELTDGTLIDEWSDEKGFGPLPPHSIAAVGTPTNITSMNFAGWLRGALRRGEKIARGEDPERLSEKVMRITRGGTVEG